MDEEQNPQEEETNEEESEGLESGEEIHPLSTKLPVSGMYENWFLDYASYVILERAVPAIEDGLKPVQRRILHAMKEMDDGRFNKVANIIGQTMQYHPHGDAAIGDATINLGQKDLLIETQGNWGDIRTGDGAAAPRYIEARLSKFALEVAFNAKTTTWQTSYDGRKREPVTLPMKFPLLLAQGVEGIAVGLSTKVMPHNFCELLKGSIDILKEKKVKLYPDFPTGGMVDVSNYNDGERGGRIRVRAKIEEQDKKTLIIKDIPYGVTTTSLMESIVKANDNGKIKIKKVVDNTAKDVEIVVSLATGVSPDITIDALYAFTQCEISISPNACVIIDEKPHFLSVTDILRQSTDHTVQLLRMELQIRKGELENAWHYSSLERIFIENRIYRDIEECETWEAVLEAIDKGLDPHKKLLRREVTQEDIVRLTEIKIKRISKYDSFKADEHIKGIEDEMAEVEHHLKYLREFAIAYFEKLLEKYGKGKERKTEIKAFDNIQANIVAVANQKLYVDRQEGFVGYGLKKAEYVGDCSDLDNIIVFRDNGTMQVTKVADKSFLGKGIIHVDVFRKNDERMVYNMAYMDGKSRYTYVKRFAVTSITRDKEYQLTKSDKGSKVLYFSANPNSEAEVVAVSLSSQSKARKPQFDFNFGDILIKGRNAQGNILSKYLVRSIKFKSKGASTLGGRDIWYDDVLGRLNVDERGQYLGSFEGEDRILVVYEEGSYELTGYDLTNRYEPKKVKLIERFRADRPLTVVHYDGNQRKYFVKRFLIETQSLDKKFSFVTEASNSRMVLVSTLKHPRIKLKTGKRNMPVKEEELDLVDFIDIKGWKALGNKLAGSEFKSAKLLPLREEDEREEEEVPTVEDNSGEEPPVVSDTDVPAAKESVTEEKPEPDTEVSEKPSEDTNDKGSGKEPPATPTEQPTLF